MSANGTYVYCLVAASRKPLLGRAPKGPQGTGAVRAIDVDLGPMKPAGLRVWLIVADAPLDRYGEAEINRRLHDLDWVARAAVAHERVIESFAVAPAVLPMKLLTIFRSDDRAVDHVQTDPARVRAILGRVLHHEEWGVRLVLDRARARTAARDGRRSPPASGAGYLAREKALHDQTAELASRAREVVADLREFLERHASQVRNREAREMPIQDGPLLLDEALLVSRARAKTFRAAVAREARKLEPQGYRIALTGPWPPYSFLQD
jgi:hypothetical protein